MFDGNAPVIPHSFLMCSCLVTNEHYRVVTVQHFDLLFKVIYKNGKAFQGHLRQDQTD
jgi:hypothetical protein